MKCVSARLRNARCTLIVLGNVPKGMEDTGLDVNGAEPLDSPMFDEEDEA